MNKSPKRQPSGGVRISRLTTRPAMVAHLPIGSILPDPSNPRKHSLKQTYRELILKSLVDGAISGDLDAAETVLKMVDHAERYGDPGLDRILVENWIPDHPGQTADQKTADFTAGRDAAPDKWWRSHKN